MSLIRISGINKVISALTKVGNDERGVIAELRLCGQVELLDQSRSQIRVPYTNISREDRAIAWKRKATLYLEVDQAAPVTRGVAEERGIGAKAEISTCTCEDGSDTASTPD